MIKDFLTKEECAKKAWKYAKLHRNDSCGWAYFADAGVFKLLEEGFDYYSFEIIPFYSDLDTYIIEKFKKEAAQQKFRVGKFDGLVFAEININIASFN